MRPIQVLLIALLLAGACFYFARLRSRLVDRILVLVLAAAGTVLIVMPHWSTVLANCLDVGRGVDLVTYLMIMLLTFSCLLLYSKVRALQAQLADLIRALAIEQARRPSAIPLNQPVPRQARAA